MSTDVDTNRDIIINLTVDEEADGQRVDKVLYEYMPEELEIAGFDISDLSRTYWQGFIEKGRVFSAGQNIKKSSYKVKANEELSLHFSQDDLKGQKGGCEPEDIDLDIVYEDEYLAVINKPAGMPVHPSPGHYSGTVANAIQGLWGSDLPGHEEFRPGIVHRIDKDTSGLLMVVKDKRVFKSLAESFRKHEISRCYKAFVYGYEKVGQKATIEAPIARSAVDKMKMEVRAEGKYAFSRYECLKTYENALYRRGEKSSSIDISLFEYRLLTGRTHQIRVHSAFINYPVAGDKVYAPTYPDMGMSRQALHAAELGFIHPVSAKEITLTADLPEDIAALEKRLENSEISICLN